MTTLSAQAAASFVAAYNQGKLPFPSTKPRQQSFLKDAGVIEATYLSTADIKERAAALVWVRHAVANNIAPDTWSSLLSPSLLADVRTLYPIPPAGADPAETDLHRLAKVVSLFMPDVPVASSSSSTSPPQGGDINVQRPPDALGAPSGASSTPPPAQSPAQPALAVGAKRKYMIHDEHFLVLPDAVYTA